MSITFYLLATGLILGHLLGDFFFQPNKWVDQKRELKWASRSLYFHSLIAGTLPVFLAWSTLNGYALLNPHLELTQFGISGYALLAVTSVVLHTVVDGIKSSVSAKLTSKGSQLWVFLIDQLLHLLTLGILLLALTTTETENLKSVISSRITAHNLISALMLVALTLPTSVVLKQVLRQLDFEPEGDTSLPQGGQLIGYVERIIIFICIVTGHAEAIGWLLASKSILRFSTNNERRVTEYVLAGTLLSTLIAIVFGLIAKAV